MLSLANAVTSCTWAKTTAGLRTFSALTFSVGLQSDPSLYQGGGFPVDGHFNQFKSHYDPGHKGVRGKRVQSEMATRQPEEMRLTIRQQGTLVSSGLNIEFKFIKLACARVAFSSASTLLRFHVTRFI